jgi:PIN like domain
MLLDNYVRDYRAFMTDFVGSLQSEETYLYLDTSFLIWLIRLGSEARSEILEWLRERPSTGVRIPVWAAHELHRHVIAATAKSNLTTTVQDAISKLGDFIRIAAERADNKICTANGFADRAAFLRELLLSYEKITHLAKVAQLDDPALQAATQEVITFVNAHVLSSNLGPALQELSSIGTLRMTHLIPPGFQDKKQENSFGDLFIWNEIVADLAASHSGPDKQERDVVFITRDKKTDWVTAAPFVIDLRGDTVKGNRDRELDVTLPHPFLLHELRGSSKCGRLYITQPSLVASALYAASTKDGSANKFYNWFSASHTPTVIDKLASVPLNKTAPDDQKTRSTPIQVEQQPVVPQTTTATVTLDAIGVSELSIDVQGDVKSFLGALPIEQEEVLATWQSSVRTNSLSGIKLGRTLSELIKAKVPGLAERILVFLTDLFRQAGPKDANLTALGLIGAAYFDQYSQLRRSPDVSIGAVVISLEPEEAFQPAFSALNRLLKSADAESPYFPGSGRPMTPFKIDVTEAPPGSARTIRDIRIADQSVLVGPGSEDNPRSLSKLLNSSPNRECTGQELRLLVAREYQIPPDRLDAKQDKYKLSWEAGSCLVTLDLASPGGFTTSSDEDPE